MNNYWKLMLVVLGLLSLSYAFTTIETEIFQLQNEISTKYGPDMNFYKFLKLPKLQKSSTKEITKNLRKLSKKYHPDKNPKYRKLYERLNLATQILSNGSNRKIYDYYLQNGFPNYDFHKGGFYFTRVKPKTWFILAFIWIIINIGQYIISVIQYRSQRSRIESFISQCKQQDDTNGLGVKELTFKQHEEDEGKNLVVRFSDVYVVEPDGNETLISPDTLNKPSIKNCLFWKIPASIWNGTLGRFVGSTPEEEIIRDSKKYDGEQTRKRNKVKRNPAKKGQKKMELPNGKVIYSRK
ncbi:Erj5p [Saccharomyces paradoxus]|uniref:Erj5p n=1 Tax=Saccharomyces paradoxus TaxID=27291 RepID=A0A8B8UR00_SACPA|nr:Erj5 [Saccharomyces paradoxus]QHS73074.1 Erj5 [Saccharomyces paradoxus]